MVIEMNPLFCECCGDNVKAVYPCRFIFHDGRELPINICPDCMKHGKLILDLPKRNLISILLNRLNTKKWKNRGEKQ